MPAPSAPKGPRHVATGEAQPASSRAQRNPWNRVHVLSPAPAGQRTSFYPCSVAHSCRSLRPCDRDEAAVEQTVECGRHTHAVRRVVAAALIGALRLMQAPKVVSAKHQPAPFFVELIPVSTIEFATVRESGHVSRGSLRVEGSEVAKFSSYRSGCPPKMQGKLAYERVARSDSPKRNAATQLECENQVLARPERNVIGRLRIHRFPHAA